MSGSDDTKPDDDAAGGEDRADENRGLVFRDSPLSPRNDEHDEGARDADEPFSPEPAEAEQLPLGDDAIALPWLEGDDEEDEAQGYDAGQFISLVMLGLLALALIVGGIWWATRKSSDPELVADGSLVEAPEAPYKEKPKDAGGMTFEGTGDTSFAVSQGQSRAVRLGQEGAGDAAKPAQPGFATVGATPAAAASAGAAKPGQATPPAAAGAASAGTAPATGGVGVQVGAFSTRKSAEEAWQKLSQRYSALSGVRYRIVEGKADIGTVFRLQAVSGDADGAKALCGKLKAGGLACQVKN